MRRTSALGQACNAWATLMCPIAARSIAVRGSCTNRGKTLARWRQLEALDTALAAMYLEARERSYPEHRPFRLKDFVDVMQRTGTHESTIASIRRRYTALAEFGLAHLEGHPQRVRLDRDRHPGWPQSARTIGAQIADALDAWARACAPAEQGAPIRDSDTARCLAHMMDAGLAPGHPITQAQVLTDMLDESRGLAKRRRIETHLANRTFDLRARARVAFTRRRDILAAHGIVTVHHAGARRTILTLTHKGRAFHAALDTAVPLRDAA